MPLNLWIQQLKNILDDLEQNMMEFLILKIHGEA